MVFADSTQSIVLADMSGDGLMDIVRIRCSEVVLLAQPRLWQVWSKGEHEQCTGI